MAKPKRMNHKKDDDITIEINTNEQELQEEVEASSSAEEEATTDAETTDDSISEMVEEAFEEQDEVMNGPLMAKLKSLQEQNLRLRAEFANYKKRVEREQLDFAPYLKGEMMKKLLPILDDFKIMLEKSSGNVYDQSLLEGAKLIFGKFEQILEKEGLLRINALGENFDPNLHEALMMKSIENEAENDVVVEVFQEGFMLNDKLLRPSKVIVGKFEA